MIFKLNKITKPASSFIRFAGFSSTYSCCSVLTLSYFWKSVKLPHLDDLLAICWAVAFRTLEPASKFLCFYLSAHFIFSMLSGTRSLSLGLLIILFYSTHTYNIHRGCYKTTLIFYSRPLEE